MLTGLGVHFPVKDIHLERLGPTEALTILADASGTAVDLGSSALQTLVQRCDGLPLALRITGRRISKLSAANLLTVASELDSARAPLDFFQLSDDPSSRLRDVFSWSYKKLDTTVQKMFQMFGVTPSLNLDQTAASAISGYPIEIASQALRSLADSHLLVETTLNRYEPHDLLRSYAREMAVNRSDILSRTFNYYINTADYADDLVAPQRYRPWRNSSTHNKFTDRSVALEWLNAELSNIVSLCEEDDERHDRHRWRLAYAVRGYFYFTKRFDAWIRTHTAALAAAIRLGDARAEALTRNNLGMALMGTGELTTAAAHYRQAEELFYAEEDRHGWSNALVNLAAVLRRQGNCDEALTLQKKALAFYRERGLSRNIGITLRSMAQVEVEMGMTREAIKHVEEAISLAVTINLYLDAAQACNRLGLIHQITKQYAVAEIAHHLAIDYSKKVDGRHEEGIALWNLGKLARLTDNHKGETTWLSAAYVLFNAIGAKEALDVAEELSISST
jgi:tetratricopeptide (TPR) repeat protein